MELNKISARLFGIFSILSFLSYGIGIGLLEVVQSYHSMPGNIFSGRNGIILGSLLVVLLHTTFNLTALTVMLPVLKPFSQTLSYLYFVPGIFATFMLAIGAVFLVLSIPLSESFITQDANTQTFHYILKICSGGYFYCYQFGMAIWGLGGLFLCFLLYQTRLVPKLLPLLGFAGYLIFIAGTVLEVFGYPLGLVFSIPGGLFEITLSVWLIIKGFAKPVPVYQRSVS